jgi:hypothetical protein
MANKRRKQKSICDRLCTDSFEQIVYISIMGPVILAAFLEWFLFIAAFNYCLVKVFQKAEHWSIRILSIAVIVAFTALRFVFSPLLSGWTNTDISQSYFLTGHDCDTSTSFKNISILSSSNGIIPFMVRFLVLCWPVNDSMAIVRFSIDHPQRGSPAAHQDCFR